MKKWIPIIGFVVVLCGIGVGLWVWNTQTKSGIVSPLGVMKERPLDTYSIENLANRVFEEGEIILDEAMATASGFTEYRFHFTSDGKRVNGLAHIPKSDERGQTFPVIVQFRGFVDPSIYAPGVGTKRSAEVYADNGFISLAPDFLGYGGSDKPGTITAFEERFETYTTALNLLSSVKSFPLWDGKNLFVWGHSNGGQIALTFATILGSRGYPTTVWAPVTKPFPYNVLYYTDEFDDLGKALRRELATFEKDYDTDLYSLTDYLDRIRVPVQIHQGTADEAVPVRWTNDFVNLLKEKGKDVLYFTYPEADHNMTPGWDSVVSRDIQFFRSHMAL